MREILFRGKTINNGKWIEGYLFENWGDAYICLGTENGNIMKEKVNEVTVGQYTGLKDKNGTEIFEGDIVQNIYGDIFTVGYYGEHWYGYVLTTSDGCVDHLYEYDEYEVIGNIHDNPELLEEELK